jgi:hypothetical protein
LTGLLRKKNIAKVHFFINQQTIISIIIYISTTYQKPPKNRKNQSKVLLRAENRSHEGGKMSVYPTNKHIYATLRKVDSATKIHVGSPHDHSV